MSDEDRRWDDPGIRRAIYDRMRAGSRDPTVHSFALRVWAAAGEPIAFALRAKAVLSSVPSEARADSFKQFFAFGTAAMSIDVPEHIVEEVWRDNRRALPSPPEGWLRPGITPEDEVKQLAALVALEEERGPIVPGGAQGGVVARYRKAKAAAAAAQLAARGAYERAIECCERVAQECTVLSPEHRAARACSDAIRARAELPPYVYPRDRGAVDDTWQKIGATDACGSRSLWIRVTWRDPETEDRAERIELRSGREGDDAYASIDDSNPQWSELSDVFLRVPAADEEDARVARASEDSAELARADAYRQAANACEAVAYDRNDDAASAAMDCAKRVRDLGGAATDGHLEVDQLRYQLDEARAEIDRLKKSRGERFIAAYELYQKSKDYSPAEALASRAMEDAYMGLEEAYGATVKLWGEWVAEHPQDLL